MLKPLVLYGPLAFCSKPLAPAPAVQGLCNKLFLCTTYPKRRMAVLGCTAAACVCPSHFPSPAKFPFSQHSSSHVFFSSRDGTKSALVPSCLSSAFRSCNYTSLPLRNYRVLPLSLCTSSPISRPRSSFVHSGDRKIVGLSVDLNGEFVKDLRRAAMRKNLRTAGTNVRSMSGQSEGVLEETIKRKNSQNAVVVYSKSWCPTVKGLFTKFGVSFELVELDQLVDEQDVQEALRRLTGQSTVPNVFIGGKHIGGCDDTMALHKRGELIPALEAAGLKITAA